MRNFKGFIFTIDSIFALIVAAAATSLLLLSLYTPSVSIQGTTTEAFSVAQNLLQSTVGQAARGSPFVFALASGYLSRQYTWPQYGNNASLSSSTSGYGPQLPLILFTYQTLNAINPSPVVADGLVFFTTNGAGSQIYGINATTGALVFNTPAASGSSFTGSPAVFRGIVYTANSAGYVDAYTENGAYFGAVNLGATSANTYLEIENQNIEDNLSFAYPYNLTSIISAQQVAALYSNGEYFALGANSPTTANIMGFSLRGNTLIKFWSNTIATSGSYYSPIASGAGSTYFSLLPGGTPTIYAYSLGGNSLWTNTLSSTARGGASVFNNTVYIKTANTLYSFSQAGKALFAVPFTGVVPNDNFNFTPVATPSLVYALVNDSYLLAFSPVNGNIIWNVTLSSNTLPRLLAPNYQPQGLAVAYGNAYAAVGNVLYAVGTCKADTGSSLLQSIATFYLNGQGACGTLLLNKSYGTNKVAIYVNNTYAPSLYAATFSGGNYIEVPGLSSMIAGQEASVDFWVYPSGNPTGNSIYAGFRNNKNADFYVMQVAGSNTIIGRYANTASAVNTVNTLIVPYQWNNVALIYNGSYISIYLNGVLSASKDIGSTFITNSVAAFTMGGDTVSGSRDYFTGQLSDVQLYSSALNASQVQYLYSQGIGSTPFSTADVVGWWPLEGDTNDYSHYNYGIGFGNPTFSYSEIAFIPPGLQNSYQISKATIPLSIAVNGVYNTYNIGVVIWR